MSGNNDPQQQDDIDYFLSHEGARPSYGRSGSGESGDEGFYEEEVADLRANLLQLAATVAVSSVKFFSNVALKRLGVLLAVQKELVKDGRLPQSYGDAAVPATPSSSPAARTGTTTAAKKKNGFASCALSPLRSVARGVGAIHQCATQVYSTGGVSAFFRGGKVLVALMTANLLLRGVQGATIARLSLPPKLDAMPLVRWTWLIGVVPLVVSLTSWPLVALRQVIMTNFMADIVAPLPRPHDNENEKERSNKDGKKTQPQDAGESMYLYGGVGELWMVLQSRMGWRGILSHGLEVELADTYALLAVRLGLNASLMTLLRFTQQAPEERLLSPLAVGLLLQTSVAVANALRQPFRVVAARMALLAPVLLSSSTAALPPGTNHNDRKTGEEEEYRRCGRRYRSGLHCARSILREEGAKGLFAGLAPVLLVSTAVPIAQMVVFGTIRLSFVDS